MPNEQRVPELGPLEFSLTRLLWKEAPRTARELLEAHNRGASRALAYTTVMTLLGRLTEKGVISVDRSSAPYGFRPLVTREQVLRQRVRDFVDTFFEGRSIDLAMRLVEEEPLSEEAVERLETILRKARQTAGD